MLWLIYTKVHVMFTFRKVSVKFEVVFTFNVNKDKLTNPGIWTSNLQDLSKAVSLFCQNLWFWGTPVRSHTTTCVGLMTYNLHVFFRSNTTGLNLCQNVNNLPMMPFDSFTINLEILRTHYRTEHYLWKSMNKYYLWHLIPKMDGLTVKWGRDDELGLEEIPLEKRNARKEMHC